MIIPIDFEDSLTLIYFSNQIMSKFPPDTHDVSLMAVDSHGPQSVVCYIFGDLLTLLLHTTILTCIHTQNENQMDRLA